MLRALEQPNLGRSASELSQDEVLMRAHMAASSSFLHIRRTLEYVYYLVKVDFEPQDCDLDAQSALVV